jgi:hypothetical protein
VKASRSVVASVMHDSRLIGTWRSDARKTALEIAARRDLRLPKNKKLLGLFGKLELRYIKQLCFSRFKDHESVSAYKVVAKDDYSVALVMVNPIAGKQIVHIHYDGNYYWVPLGSSGLREFFKRVKSKKRANRPRKPSTS